MKNDVKLSEVKALASHSIESEAYRGVSVGGEWAAQWRGEGGKPKRAYSNNVCGETIAKLCTVFILYTWTPKVLGLLLFDLEIVKG